MATFKSVVFFLLLLVFFLLPPSSNAHHLFTSCKYDAIYQLGDSISDTGNLIRENTATPFHNLPYGQNFYKNATGRCSNGLLMIDFLALETGIPMLEPYLNTSASFISGVNFAVAGSTALSSHTLANFNITSPVTNTSLNKQLDWMFNFFNERCHNSKDCAIKLRRSLFMVGEIGGNDYNYAFFQGKTMEEVNDMVPYVVQAIKDAVNRVIGFGALQVVVPGNFPIGCVPIYLTAFQTNNSAAYDEFQCLKTLNNFSMNHNRRLLKAIDELRQENPGVTILYADYYHAYQWILRHASHIGFDTASIQKACCGTGGDYNFSLAKMCGAPNVPVCANPDAFISWDGVHSTQKAYEYMTKWLSRDIFPKIHCIF